MSALDEYLDESDSPLERAARAELAALRSRLALADAIITERERVRATERQSRLCDLCRDSTHDHECDDREYPPNAEDAAIAAYRAKAEAGEPR